MKKRLEDAIRQAESPIDLVLLLRGGEDAKEKIFKHADLLEEGFTYGNAPARGISLFAAQGDLDAWALLGNQLKTYRRYCRLPAAELIERFVLLPTFATPHWTLMLQAADGSEVPEDELIEALLATLGPALDNPRREPRRKRRNPRQEER